MTPHPALSRPPAIEAIFEVQVVFPQAVESSEFEAMHASFEKEYPNKEYLRSAEFGFENVFGPEARAITRDHGVRGCRFWNSEKSELVQCKADGFAFNRLKPYVGWDDAFGKASRFWEIYRSRFSQAQVIYVGLRYVNQLVLPADENGLKSEDYFKVHLPGPEIPGVTPTHFVQQGQFSQKQTGFEANWIFARQDCPQPDRMAFLLDTAVFVRGPRALEGQVPQLWASMRPLKNELFFSSLTAKTLALYE